ncbi:MAG: GFA family protein [Lysobacterales bacterium]
MTDSPTARSGTCLCGAITLNAEHASPHVGGCHCRMCRRWGGGPYLELDCGSQVSITGEEHLSVFSSSDWAERGFCARCGTHIFYRLKESGQHMVAVGLFDDQEGLTFKRQVFIDEKPPYYQFADDTENLTGEDIFALFGGDN